jgi:hypothetical protein
MLLLELVVEDFGFFHGAGGFIVLAVASSLALYMAMASTFAVFYNAFVPNIKASSSSHYKGIHPRKFLLVPISKLNCIIQTPWIFNIYCVPKSLIVLVTSTTTKKVKHVP